MSGSSEESRRRRRRLLHITFMVVLIEASIAYLAIGGYRTLTGSELMNRAGNPIGADFVQYYAVSTMALEGRAVETYQLSELHRRQQQVIGAEVGEWPWFYPPTFMLVVLPLGLAPYLAALALWLGLTLLAYLAIVYRIAPHRMTPLLALLFPGAADVLFSGQNGFLSAALLGGGLLLLERRPWLAGLLIGLLSYKPHLGALIPVALIAGGHWRAFAAAAITTVAFAGLSAAVFGLEPWLAFLDATPLARDVVEQGQSPWYKMPTVFAAARMLGLGIAAAWVVQGGAALAAAVLVFKMWRRNLPLALRASILVLATAFATPYAQFYDMAILALPGAWLAWEAWRGHWLAGERAALLVLWIAPLLAWGLGLGMGIPFWPLMLALVLAVAMRRAAQVDRPAGP
jgi:hypothetical protein